MIYLIDSVLIHGSHSYWMIKIIERFNTGAKVNLLSLPDKPTVSDVLNVIEKLQKLVAPNDIVLCCWQIDRNKKVDAAFKELARYCTIVAAAGNSSMDIENFSPQSVDEVLTIGCINKSGGIASMSNSSKTKKLKWVPGTNLMIDGHVENGTSVSAAIYAAWLAESLEVKDPYLLQEKLEEYSAVLLHEITQIAKNKHK